MVSVVRADLQAQLVMPAIQDQQVMLVRVAVAAVVAEEAHWVELLVALALLVLMVVDLQGE
jgi:hypothetical protein